MVHTGDRDDIHFTVAHAEIFGLLGPNGAGKTTTIEIPEGLRRADVGQVSLAPLCMLP
jgi:ABC-2 type transport system ATP-binding protein